eukprot:768821-Hanusia_phi.AAC.7
MEMMSQEAEIKRFVMQYLLTPPGCDSSFHRVEVVPFEMSSERSYQPVSLVHTRIVRVLYPLSHAPKRPSS